MKASDPKLWLAILSLIAVTGAVWSTRDAVSPGPLTAVHGAAKDLADPASCERCHGGLGTSMASACGECHAEIEAQLDEDQGFHGTRAGVDVGRCGACHVEHHGDARALVDDRAFALAGVADRAAFVHDFAEFRLTGVHARLLCDECHPAADAARLEAGAKRFLGLDQACTACHEDPHEGKFVKGCEECHGQERPFTELANFVHTARLPLTGAHAGLACARCHEPGTARSVEALGSAAPPPPERACQDCHESPHREAFVAEVSRARNLEPAASCAECHAADATTFAVEPLAMSPELHAASGFALSAPHDRAECSDCHADGPVPSGAAANVPASHPPRSPAREASDCAACHDDPHRGQFDSAGRATSCTACHAATHFEPALFDVAAHASVFALEGAHATVACDECHLRREVQPTRFRGTPSRCESCHDDVHGGVFQPALGSQRLDALVAELSSLRGSCEACHTTARFDETSFAAPEHGPWTGFELAGAHSRASCESCHRRSAAPEPTGRTFGRVAEVFPGPASSCATCHADVHRGAFEVDGLPREVEGRTSCARCHSEERFDELLEPFDHAAWTGFALVEAHERAACAACHGTLAEVSFPAGATNPARTLGFAADLAFGPPRECSSCHADVHGGAFDREGLPERVDGDQGCARCHTRRTFADGLRETFDHGAFTAFALEGAHARTACEACHVPAREPDEHGRRFGRATGTTCAECHADPHAGQFASGGATSCERCHESASSFAELDFDHGRDARFALDAVHARLDCSACHKPWPLPAGGSAVRYKPLGTACADCHGFGQGKGR